MAKRQSRGKAKKLTALGAAFLGTKSLTIVQKEPTFTTVVRLDLPAGTYLLKATGVVNRLTHNLGSDLLVRCQLTGGPTVLPLSYFHGPTSASVSTSNVAMSGRIDLAKAGSATVRCTHSDFADARVEAAGFELFAQAVTVQNND